MYCFFKAFVAAHASGCTAAEVVGDLHRSPLQVWLCVGAELGFIQSGKPWMKAKDR